MSHAIRTILILDDDEVVRKSLMNYFEDHQWRVIASETGEKALDLIALDKPDCAVVDIRLPGIDGNTFIRNVHKVYPKMVCVVYTGSPEYHLPMDISSIPIVCERVFAKPIYDISEMETELLNLLDRSKNKGDRHE